MKRILFTVCILALGVTVTEAQTKKKSKAKAPTAQQKHDAAVAKMQSEKRAKFEEDRINRLREDSIRIEDEAKTEIVKDSLRKDWKAKKLAQVDSTNNENWKKTMADKDAWYDNERSQNAINKKAGLNAAQGQKVKAINEEYNNRAKAIKDDASLDDATKKTQLSSLNEERRAKIKEAIGSKNLKKLEKERHAYAQKNTDDYAAKWVEETAAPSKKKKNK